MWRLLLGTMGVKSLVQGLNAAATAGFEPRTVWSEVRRRNRLATGRLRLKMQKIHQVNLVRLNLLKSREIIERHWICPRRNRPGPYKKIWRRLRERLSRAARRHDEDSLEIHSPAVESIQPGFQVLLNGHESIQRTRFNGFKFNRRRPLRLPRDSLSSRISKLAWNPNAESRRPFDRDSPQHNDQRPVGKVEKKKTANNPRGYKSLPESPNWNCSTRTGFELSSLSL